MSGRRHRGEGVGVYGEVLWVVRGLRNVGGIVEAVELTEADFDAVAESYGVPPHWWSFDVPAQRGTGGFHVFRVPEEVQRA